MVCVVEVLNLVCYLTFSLVLLNVMFIMDEHCSYFWFLRIGLNLVHIEGGANSESFCIPVLGEYWHAHKRTVFVGAHGHSACITGSCDYLKDHSGGCGGQSFWLQQQKLFSCEHSSLCYRVNLVLLKHLACIFKEYVTICRNFQEVLD